MSAQSTTRRMTHVDLAKKRAASEKIAVLTCYDASFAALCDAAGVDALLIGDSLGMVLQGHDSTLPVTVADIAYHTAAVTRGSQRPLVIADMPFGSFQESPQQAFRNAVALMAAGAQMVKIEGGAEMAETTHFLTSRGIPVCAHVGLTPQSVHQLGGYRVQGKDDAGAAKLKADALAQQSAGATLIVLEAIPAALAAEVSALLAIPTIGIGASKECDGQILVLEDMLGLNPRVPKFVKKYGQVGDAIEAAVAAYAQDVKARAFPTEEHVYTLKKQGN